MEHGLAIDIAVCIVAAFVAAVACKALRQPMLLAYLLAGFVIGPHGFQWVTDAHSIQTISSIGLILLLFMIGLEMDLRNMAAAGRLILIASLAQIIGCVAVGWVLLRWFGPVSGWLEGLYLAVALALSSTVIIVKILYDKRALGTLAGRVTLGVLVVQDLFAILFLAIQPDLKDPAVGTLAAAFGKTLLLIGVAWLVGRYVLPGLFRFISRLPELLLIGALAWCFALAGFAGELGLSREMGALVAGAMISSFPYTLDIAAKVTNIRDFFVTLFFVGLGLTIPLPTWHFAAWTLILGGFVVLSRFLTVFPALYRQRLGHRASLLPTLHLSQISELSLVLLAIGKDSGDVSTDTLSLAAFVFSALAILSTYAIPKDEAVLGFVSPLLKRAGLPDLPNQARDEGESVPPPKLFVLGFSWSASSLLENITTSRPDLLDELCVIDFNPLVIQRLKARGVRVIYGDITQQETLLHAGVGEAEILVCTLPDTILKGLSNRKLLRLLRRLNPQARIIVHAERLASLTTLYDEGAAYVSAPRLPEADELLRAIDAAKLGDLQRLRDVQLDAVSRRDEVVD